jgi:hypothetical protein
MLVVYEVAVRFGSEKICGLVRFGSANPRFGRPLVVRGKMLIMTVLLPLFLRISLTPECFLLRDQPNVQS